MKAQSAVGGAKAPDTSISKKAQSSAKKSGDATSKTESKGEKVEISAEAKAKAKELAEENKALKSKLKESRERLPNNEALKVRKSSEPRSIKKPGIFLIGGMSLGGLTESKGIAAMGEHIPQAEHFQWDQESSIIKQISRRPKGEPIILIGHGLGGDSAVNIANKLNSLEHGYRKVDLLITMDSTGNNNDIIPQNVKENLNFIDGEGGMFSDGPNIARDGELTKVSNKLIKEDASKMDEASGVQFQVFDKVNSVLAKAQEEKSHQELMEKVKKAQMVDVSSDKIAKLVAKDLSNKY